MAGWTTPRTWVTGEVVTAAQLNAHIRDNLGALNGYVLKTADQSITSSATLTNDTHLLYTIPAAGTYEFNVWLMALASSDTNGDINIGFSFPTGTCHFQGVGPNLAALTTGSSSSGEWTARNSATSGVTAIAYGMTANGGVPLAIHLNGLLIATATGTLRLMWAQQASSANPTTVKAGSRMFIQQVA